MATKTLPTFESSILIREFYIEDDVTVYTGRDCVMPMGEFDWVDMVERWADGRIPGWRNIECFLIKSTDYVVLR